jgi:hypothetical protein
MNSENGKRCIELYASQLIANTSSFFVLVSGSADWDGRLTSLSLHWS